MSGASDSVLAEGAPLRHFDGDEDGWLPNMSWAIPKHAKKRVNWAGKMLVTEPPETARDEYGRGSDEYYAWLQEYFEALDIVNNWRSSHNFPLNTFHIGLKSEPNRLIPKRSPLKGSSVLLPLNRS